ncbi:MAG TPA: ABC transporter ATP-binding protein [Clostridia bacterium]|jgi:ATP-binding cassette subfamily B protein|nr:ABC transporter ATP-binding protein [Clostridia bacterium]
MSNKKVPYINSTKEQLIGIGLEIISQSANALAFIIFTLIAGNIINGVIDSNSVLIESTLKKELPICLILLVIVYPIFKYSANIYKNRKIFVLKECMLDLLFEMSIKIQSNQFLNNFNMDINDIEKVIERIYPGIINSLLTSIYAIVLLSVGYDFMFVIILVTTIIFNLLGGYFALRNFKLEGEINEKKRDGNSHILNIFSNNLIFNIFPNARLFLNKTIDILTKIRKDKDIQAKNNTYYNILFYVSEVIRVVGVVYIGARYTDIGIGGITSLLLLIAQSSVLFRDFSENLLGLKKFSIAKNKLSETFLMENSTTKETEVEVERNINDEKGIEFRNVFFSYNSGSDLFKGLSFKANNNELTLIKGDIGRGKSTMLKLILKKLNVNDGNIYINGKSINILDDSDINKLITYVDQGYKIFSGTVVENITMFNRIYDSNAIDEILKQVDLYDDIYSDELNIYSLVNRDGDNFSGGQKQRIAIARALYKNSEIILFDEPFSSLDKDNVDTLKEIIEYLSITKTIIVVSHHNYLDDIADNVIQI